MNFLSHSVLKSNWSKSIYDASLKVVLDDLKAFLQIYLLKISIYLLYLFNFLIFDQGKTWAPY